MLSIWGARSRLNKASWLWALSNICSFKSFPSQVISTYRSFRVQPSLHHSPAGSGQSLLRMVVHPPGAPGTALFDRKDAESSNLSIIKTWPRNIYITGWWGMCNLCWNICVGERPISIMQGICVASPSTKAQNSSRSFPVTKGDTALLRSTSTCLFWMCFVTMCLIFAWELYPLVGHFWYRKSHCHEYDYSMGLFKFILEKSSVTVRAGSHGKATHKASFLQWLLRLCHSHRMSCNSYGP